MYSLYTIGLGVAAQFHAQLEMMRCFVDHLGCFKILAKKSITYPLQRFVCFFLLVRDGNLFWMPYDKQQQYLGPQPHS